MTSWTLDRRCLAGLPVDLLRAALGLGGGSFTLDAAHRRYALKLAADELRPVAPDAMLTRRCALIACTRKWVSRSCGTCRRAAAAPCSRTGPTNFVVGEGVGMFVLKRLMMPCAMVIQFMPCSPAWACRTMYGKLRPRPSEGATARCAAYHAAGLAAYGH